MATVNAEKIAKALNLTEARVHQLVHEGLPKEGRGQFDPIKCLMFYIRYLQNKLELKTVPTLDGSFVGEREERIRLLRTQADLAEIELSEQRSQLVSIEDVQKEWTDFCETTTAVIMAIPSQLAPQLLGQTSRMMVHAKIEGAIKEALLRLSKREPRRNRSVPAR
jgi:phage terminase Nu1 subunit (DNA packaging protein)